MFTRNQLTRAANAIAALALLVVSALLIASTPEFRARWHLDTAVYVLLVAMWLADWPRTKQMLLTPVSEMPARIAHAKVSGEQPGSPLHLAALIVAMVALTFQHFA